MTPVFNDDDAAEQGTCPPEGWHQVEIINSMVKQSKKGHWMLSWEMKIVGGEHAGATVYDNAMLEGKGAHIGKMKAGAFGVVLKKGDEVDAAVFEGRNAMMYGVPEKYKGYMNLRVDIDHGDCGYKPLTPADPNDEATFDNVPF